MAHQSCIHLPGTNARVKQGAGAETEAADEFGDREAAALLLGGRLRESPLILGRIGHGDARAINDFDPAATPELIGADTAMEFVGRVAMDAAQRIGGKARTGATIGSGIGHRPGQASSHVPGLDFANRFAAGAAGGEDLREEGPEGQALREEPTPAVGACCGRCEQARGYPRGTELTELRQRGLLERFPLGAQLLLSRTLGTAEKQAMETGKERSCISHACVYILSTMKQHETSSERASFSASTLRQLRAAYRRIEKALAQQPWLAQGSVNTVAPKTPGGNTTYTWTRKVRAKTVTVALSNAQADAFREAIAANRQIEKILARLRDVSQTALLEGLPGVSRHRADSARKQRTKTVPKGP